MAEPLKHVYNPAFLSQFAGIVKSAYPAFASERFVKDVLKDNWEALELKARMRRITNVLGEHLPDRYEDALDVLLAIAPQCSGFPYLFFPDFVEVYGMEERHWARSMLALERFTQRSSAEFAVRPFLLRDPVRMMEQMLRWTEHPVDHVRRLASEGCRPRLPWGQSLPMFKRDPSPVLPVLEQLKADPSLYVRKSVANNLNDIAKDHPQLVLDTASRWKDSDPHTDWIIRHGCRTLIKGAFPGVLHLFGYAREGSLVAHAALTASPVSLPIGGSCELTYELHIREGEAAKLRIAYAVDFVKASGRSSRKQFLLSDRVAQGGALIRGVRTHHWRELTTRRHYPGLHRIVLLVNGIELAETAIELQAALPNA
ncbi:hypothetical protein IDH44_00915 [Paenibacillus sp. IB182496]|uniref:3-methyladenine DNA glycosylase AlkC n=1 Tax=Paenibacillus sabuli TaxID=2772509 RepID=A0A927GPZ1_9BACL|nr:hypothetical protein [Paenibacillus sabuli]MBD2843736.1 hypothetical protein [Paenibacillus sabuli]